MQDNIVGVARSSSQKFSDKCATISMPGVFRRTKTAVLGVSAMPNDPLAAQRRDLGEYESMVSLLSGCTSTLRAAVEMLANAPITLFDPLQRFYDNDVPGHNSVVQICKQLAEFMELVKKSEPHMEEINQLLHDMCCENEQLKQSFRDRDEKFQNNIHYEGKVQKMQDQIVRNGSSQKLVEKMNRNVQKKHETDQSFQHSLSETGEAANNLLTSKWQKTAQVIAKMCHYYAELFSVGMLAARDFSQLAELLVQETSSYAMRKKGEDLIAAAKEKMEGMAARMKQATPASTYMNSAASSMNSAATSFSSSVNNRFAGGNESGYSPGTEGMTRSGGGSAPSSSRRFGNQVGTPPPDSFGGVGSASAWHADDGKSKRSTRKQPRDQEPAWGGDTGPSSVGSCGAWPSWPTPATTPTPQSSSGNGSSVPGNAGSFWNNQLQGSAASPPMQFRNSVQSGAAPSPWSRCGSNATPWQAGQASNSTPWR